MTAVVYVCVFSPSFSRLFMIASLFLSLSLSLHSKGCFISNVNLKASSVDFKLPTSPIIADAAVSLVFSGAAAVVYE